MCVGSEELRGSYSDHKMWSFITFLHTVTASAASFLGNGLSSAGKFASAFLVILPSAEKKVRAGMSHPSVLLIWSFQCCLQAKITRKYILHVVKLTNTWLYRVKYVSFYLSLWFLSHLTMFCEHLLVLITSGFRLLNHIHFLVSCLHNTLLSVFFSVWISLDLIPYAFYT